MIGVLVQDLRFGLRLMRRNPGFAGAAVVTLALGIGATTAVFSVASDVILRPLQFPSSDRVMTVLSSYEAKVFKPMDSMYAEWRERQQSFDLFAAALKSSMILRDSIGAREISSAMVTADFFPLIGVQPSIGRLFTREDEREGSDGIAVLDNGFWRREFAASPAVLGQTINVNNRLFTIVGVLPPNAHFPTFGRPDLWRPLVSRRRLAGGGFGGTLVIGRLRDGVSRTAGQANMDAITEQIRGEGLHYRVPSAVVRPLREWLAGDVRRTLLMLSGAAGFLLLIGCANLANLLLTRGAGRKREMTIRAAIGAGRLRLVVQTLTEGLLLTAIGGSAGMVLAYAAVRAVPAIQGVTLPRMEEISVDRDFLFIGFTISLASGVFFSLAPAMQAWRRDLIDGLHRGEIRMGRLTGQRSRNVLVSVQIALVMMLLSGAGLMTNTLVRLLTVDLGFSASHVFKIEPSSTPKLLDRAAGAQYLRELAQRVREMPGVESASVTNAAPLTLSVGGYVLRYVRDGVLHEIDALGRDVDPFYFRTVGIPTLAGRDFVPADSSAKPVPLILNQYAARVLFGAIDPLGRIVDCTDNRIGPMQVIGIVGDARVLGAARVPGPQAFAPLMGGWGYASAVVVRAGVKPAALASAIRAAAKDLDPVAPPPAVAGLDKVFDEMVAEPKFYMLLLDAFAALGLVLAATGIYGVIAYAVAERTHEFGVRLALGARPSDIVRMMIASSVRIIGAGAIGGLAGAATTTKLLSSLLFEVKPNDPWTFGAALLVLLGVALAACWLAARRGAVVDPSVALRAD